ncbi:hypothetical protein H6F90_25130 [Trichocoleus sp. FACHB-591]|uniref:3D domain-containing protein n=1 Tax=Trichocoleus sp. FACHB-591 TaxID=2692872 RepID=UPI001688EFE0|nr:3D domain-containing protein [Trichocoleus sp. FACHB-591]MBD2098359.1 hypothetical protein [Trichocoleus sp. FACHB-591]
MLVKIISPEKGSRFQTGEMIEFKGTAEKSIVSIKLLAEDKWPLGEARVTDGKWAVSCKFNTSGERKVTAQGIDASGNQIVRSDLKIVLQDLRTFHLAAFDLPEPSDSIRSKTLILWATFYKVHRAQDIPDGYPLLDMAGNNLGPKLSKHDWCHAALQGTVQVLDANGKPRTFNFAGRSSEAQVDCSSLFRSLNLNEIQGTNRVCFAVSKGTFGEGTNGFLLVPFRSIAVDRTKIPIGSVIYISDARGQQITLPTGEVVKHDGYFFAADVGGAIKDN